MHKFKFTSFVMLKVVICIGVIVLRMSSGWEVLGIGGVRLLLMPAPVVV